jgi:hypothetical protein
MAQTINGTLAGFNVSSADFSFALGTQPGSGTVTFPDTGYTLPTKGDLWLTDGVDEVFLEDVYITALRDTFDAEGGRHLTCTIYDRRWTWQWGAVNGIYNELDFNGIAKQEKTLEQLIDLIMTAVGEINYNALSIPVVYPEVKWEYENPGQALNDLCDKYQLCVGFEPFDGGTIVICPLNYVRDFPTTDFMNTENSLTGDILPEKIILVGGREQVQETFKDLIPVGEDLDGSVKPINQLSYAPADATPDPADEEWPYKAWGQAMVECFANLDTEEKKKLAEKCIFKWYSIDFYKTHEDPVTHEQVLDYDPELILPLLSEISDLEVVEGKTDHMKPYVIAETTEWDGTQFKTVALGKIEEGYTIDKKIGVVKFNDPRAKAQTPLGPTSGGFTHALVYMVAAYEFKNGDADDFLYYEQPITNGTELPAIHKESSMTPWRKKDPDTGELILTNATDLDAFATQAMAQLLAQYIPQTPSVRTYPGVYQIGAWGEMRAVNIKISADSGAETEMQIGIEIPKPNIDKYEEKLNKRLLKTSVKELVTISKAEDPRRIARGANNTQKRDEPAHPSNVFGIFAKYSKEVKKVVNTVAEAITPKSIMQVVGFDESTGEFRLGKCTGDNNGALVVVQHGLDSEKKGIAAFGGVSVVEKAAGQTIVPGDKVSAEVGGVKAIKDDAGPFTVVDVKGNDIYVKPSGGGGDGKIWVEIVEGLTYPKPEAAEDTDSNKGRSWYNAKLVGADSDILEWTTGQSVTGYNNDPANASLRKYQNIIFKALQSHTTADDKRPDPEMPKTAWWEKIERIRIDRCLGWEDKDLRNCSPWYKVGAIIPVVAKNGIYYIYGNVRYTGEPDYASIRSLETEGYEVAVFA